LNGRKTDQGGCLHGMGGSKLKKLGEIKRKNSYPVEMSASYDGREKKNKTEELKSGITTQGEGRLKGRRDKPRLNLSTTGGVEEAEGNRL